MLAMADKWGYVGSSLPGLADAAKVSLEEAKTAVDKFGQPDPHSRTKDNDGRRIVEAQGGWQILNYEAHREGDAVQKEKWRLQKARQRALRRQIKKGAGTLEERLQVRADREAI